MTRTEPAFGWPAPLWRALAARRPPLPRFRSPLRGPWLTSVFASVLLVGLPLVALTGFASYVAYGAAPIPAGVLLRPPPLAWPTDPAWLYRLNQGVHVLLGLALVPVVLAKLWSVVPKLAEWPAVRSVPHALERASLLLLVGSVLFEIVTGVLNIQYDYVFGFSFYAAHYAGAWVFVGAFLIHVALKLPTMRRGLRSRSLRAELRRPDPAPEPDDGSGLVSPDPAPPTITRRGALALVGGGAALVGALSVGQVLDGPLRSTAVLLPRGRTAPGDFPVNRTFAASRIAPADVGAAWRLELLGGPAAVLLDRDRLAACEQHTADLPIACVEGWSTQQTWTGVRIRDLAALAGVTGPATAVVRSVEGAQAPLHAGQVAHPDALLALRVAGADLSLDHGFPARLIVPALPGVHCTKWVATVEFRSA